MAILKKIEGVTHLEGGGNQLLNPFTILEGLGISAGGDVADFGCGGVGYFVFAAADLVGEKGRVYAVDILKQNLESVQKRIREDNIYNIKTIWSNLEIFGGTKIPPGSLDIGLLINVLFQTDKHQDVIKEAYRLIKKGGTLAIIDWKSHATPFGPPPGNRLDKEKIVHIATVSGFRLDNEFEAGKFHYALKFTKY